MLTKYTNDAYILVMPAKKHDNTSSEYVKPPSSFFKKSTKTFTWKAPLVARFSSCNSTTTFQLHHLSLSPPLPHQLLWFSLWLFFSQLWGSWRTSYKSAIGSGSCAHKKKKKGFCFCNLWKTIIEEMHGNGNEEGVLFIGKKISVVQPATNWARNQKKTNMVCEGSKERMGNIYALPP